MKFRITVVEAGQVPGSGLWYIRGICPGSNVISQGVVSMVGRPDVKLTIRGVRHASRLDDRFFDVVLIIDKPPMKRDQLVGQVFVAEGPVILDPSTPPIRPPPEPPPVPPLVPGQLLPHALAASSARLFWAAFDPEVPAMSEHEARFGRGCEQILSARLDGGDVRVLVRPTRVDRLVLTPSAVVWSRGDDVETARQDGTARRSLASFPGLRCLAALDEEVVFTFKTEGGQAIARLNVSSGEHRVLLRCHDEIEHLLVIGERIVWSERESKVVKMARPDGTFPRRIFQAEEGVCALAGWGRDVLVVTERTLNRVPLGGGKPWEVARGTTRMYVSAAASTPDAIFLADDPIELSDCTPPAVMGATIQRLARPPHPSQTIHALPISNLREVLDPAFGPSRVQGLLVHAEAVYFAETGGGQDEGCIRRLPLDAPQVAEPIRELLASLTPREARLAERRRFYEERLGPRESRPIAPRLRSLGWNGILVEGLLVWPFLNEGGSPGLRYTATSGLTDPRREPADNDREVGFGYELIVVHRGQVPWAAPALAYLVERQLMQLGPREVLDAIERSGAFLAGPVTPLDDGITALLLTPGSLRIPASQRFAFGEVHMLCVLALTEDELAFAERGGAAEVVAKLKVAGVAELCDPFRASVLP
jgi:hypothetical protein